MNYHSGSPAYSSEEKTMFKSKKSKLDSNMSDFESPRGRRDLFDDNEQPRDVGGVVVVFFVVIVAVAILGKALGT